MQQVTYANGKVWGALDTAVSFDNDTSHNRAGIAWYILNTNGNIVRQGTYGIAGHALLKTLCAYDPSRLERMDVRFSAVVFPGETIRTEIWRTGSGKAAFRCRVLERDALVLNNGYAEYRN